MSLKTTRGLSEFPFKFPSYTFNTRVVEMWLWIKVRIKIIVHAICEGIQINAQHTSDTVTLITYPPGRNTLTPTLCPNLIANIARLSRSAYNFPPSGYVNTTKITTRKPCIQRILNYKVEERVFLKENRKQIKNKIYQATPLGPDAW